MSKEVGLFGGNSLVNSDLFEKFNKVTQNLMSGGTGEGGMRRISIRGGRFRKIVGGEQMDVSKDSAMNIIIVNAAPIARTYYPGDYNPDKSVAPTCWSPDTKAPSKDVPDDQRQSTRCADCPQNVKGSGQGQTRACRFSQRLAVCLEGDLDTVYQLQLPATSIFGESAKGKLPMGAFVKFLAEHKTPISAIVTEMSFDDDSDTPKLNFKPVRALEEDELHKVADIMESDAVMKCIEMTVAQADGVQKIASDAPALPKAKPAPVIEEDDEDEEAVEEPKKAKKKSEPAPVEEDEDDLSALVDAWDD